MMKIHPRWLVPTMTLLISNATAVRADVTIQQKTSLDAASIVHMHGLNTTSLTADKERQDTESHCEGMMSLLCGNLQSGEIVRLDKDLTWHLEPNKKRYREDVFASPEELAQMRARIQARLEKMRSCPASQKQQPVDTSKCQMSAPKIAVRKTDDKASIAGHAAQKTSATLTQTCTNPDTGDVCDTIVAYDVWLTQDDVPGSAERQAFGHAYAKKLGLDEAQGMLRGAAARFLAPYQNQIKQVTDKSEDFKGQPMKTALRVLIGGQQCAAANKAKAGDSGDASANPLGDVAQAGKALGSMVGGLFKKKKTDDAAPDAAAGASAGPAGGAPDPYAGYLQLAAFTAETVSINADTVPADKFEIPAGWTKEIPKPSKADDDTFTCPST